MNEAETRAELIDPLLLERGWGVTPGSKVYREFKITDSKLRAGGKRGARLIADYILSFKNLKLAVVEAKSSDLPVGEGIAQAKLYADKLKLDYAFAANGREVYQICMRTGKEGPVGAFPEDALVRIRPDEIKRKGRVPTNGSVFFTIFQTFMSGRDKNCRPSPNFGEYPADYFDFIIIDECHRGGANDESNWRDIMEYFSPAVQLGLTATPKRNGNADTYRYFGDPVYVYSLKEGISDGFLTPYKIKRIQTTRWLSAS